jgi:acetyl-CoA carboxylase biotin carboxyl carrier protein
VRELIDLMKENDLCEIDLRSEESRIKLRRGGQPIATYLPAAAPMTLPAGGSNAVASPAGESAPKTAGNLKNITSPIVGTFYASPNPDSDPFVKVGSKVNGETVVCIIEAMKVFNEINAGVSGTIAEILLSNGQPVEYGQVIFRVEP